MHKSKKYPLVSEGVAGFGVYQRVLAKEAGWQHLNMEARLMKSGESWQGETGEYEWGIILLSGNYKVVTDNTGHCLCMGGQHQGFPREV